MSVTNDDTIAAEVGNGVKVAFDFAYKIFAETDLLVYKETSAGVFELQVLTTNYTVVFDPIAETGTVTYLVAPLSTLRSVILRATDQTQGSAFPRENPMPEKAIEAALDKLTLIVQDLQEKVDRAPLLPIVPPEPAESIIKTRIASRALKWFFNGTEWEIVSSSQDPDDLSGTAVFSGLAAARPATLTNSIAHWYSTDTGQVDLWILAANQWFDAIA